MFGEIYPYTEDAEALKAYFHDLARKAAILMMPVFSTYKVHGAGPLDLPTLTQGVESLIEKAYRRHRESEGVQSTVASAGGVFVIVETPQDGKFGKLSVEVLWKILEGRWWEAAEMFQTRPPELENPEAATATNQEAE